MPPTSRMILVFLFCSFQEFLALPVPSDLNVVIDTDPGADDAMAILMMLSKLSRANVVAITAVTGNVGVINATKNALLTLQVANRLDIPVFAGSDQGMVYENKIDPYFGYDGLGDTFSDKPSFDFTKHDHAALALVNIVKEKPGEITILCIGPLTNLALAIHMYPRLLEDVKDVVILGGSYQGGGGTRPGVEFNTYSDPEAAAFVFSKIPVGKPVTLIPSETSHQVAMPLDWRLNTLGKLDSCYIEFLNRAEGTVLKRARVWSISDQVAAAIILNPSIIKSTKAAYLLVETCGNTGRGAVFRDDRHNTTNVKLITEVDKKGIKTMLLEYLQSSPEECKFS